MAFDFALRDPGGGFNVSLTSGGGPSTITAVVAAIDPNDAAAVQVVIIAPTGGAIQEPTDIAAGLAALIASLAAAVLDSAADIPAVSATSIAAALAAIVEGGDTVAASLATSLSAAIAAGEPKDTASGAAASVITTTIAAQDDAGDTVAITAVIVSIDGIMTAAAVALPSTIMVIGGASRAEVSPTASVLLVAPVSHSTIIGDNRPSVLREP